MKRWLTLILLAAVCLALGAAATALAEGKGRFVLDRLSHFRAPPPPPRGDRDAPPPPADGKDRAGDHLAQAYDTLMVLGLSERGEGKQTDRLLDSSREFYRTAHKAYQDGDYERAAETALAANDSARGILFTLKASAGKQARLPLPPVVDPMGPPPPRGDRPPPPPRGDRDAPPPPRGDRQPPRGDRDAPPPPPPGDRPPPPRGDRDAPPPPPRGDRPPPPPRGDRDAPPPPRGDREPPPPPPGGPGAALAPEAAAKDIIQRADDRLNDAPADSKGPGRAFLDAAHRSLDLAKQAQQDGDSFKAVNLARAAEAWSHVEEHLQRADGAARDGPPPAERRERPREELKRQPPMPPSTD